MDSLSEPAYALCRIPVLYNDIRLWQFLRIIVSVMKKYVCDVCGYIYDPALGDPENGVEPGTAFEDIPDDWVCPLCGVGKEDFSPVEE